MKKFLNLVLVLCIVFTLALVFAIAGVPIYAGEESPPSNFVFDENGDFTILHLADMHEILYKKTDINQETKDFIKEAVLANNPDLIILGGDNIFPESTILEIAEQQTLKTIDAFAVIMEELKQKWTLLFGNHDDEAIFNKTQQYERCMLSPYFVGGYAKDNPFYTHYVDEENDMVANVKYPIYNKDGELKFNIFTIDTGSYRKTSNNISETVAPDNWYNYIRDTQIDWYKKQAGTTIPNIALFHIPQQEFKYYFEQKDNKAVVEEYVGRYGGYATSREPSNFFNEVTANTNIKGMFTGHNHSNTLTMKAKINDKKMLISTTGRVSQTNDTNWLYGNSRIIKVNENGSVATYEYIHQEMINYIKIN